MAILAKIQRLAQVSCALTLALAGVQAAAQDGIEQSMERPFESGPGAAELLEESQAQTFERQAAPAPSAPETGGAITVGSIIITGNETLPDSEFIDPKRPSRISRQTLNGLNSRLNITYARYGERTLEMDVYRPKSEWGRLPAVVCIHGGGWWKGHRSNHAKIAQALAAPSCHDRQTHASLHRTFQPSQGRIFPHGV